MLAALKLALVSDLSVQIIYAPSDDAIYVERAYHLLKGEAFGPFSSRTLLKLPGLSMWLAGLRVAGLPYLLALNLMYIAAGFYFAAALLRSGLGSVVSLLTLAVFLFSPITLGYEWIRIIREPLAIVLLVTLAAAMLYLLCQLRHAGNSKSHVVVFAGVFAFALLVREDDVLLWALFAMFVLASACAAWGWGVSREKGVRLTLLLAFALPIASAYGLNVAVRAFVESRYGAPLLHDLSEGELPRLLAAMRSVDSSKDNRMAMVTQEALSKLHAEIPGLRPVIERLPRPHPNSFSCLKDGVCSELGNGWLPIWFKDAAFDTGLTPTLPDSQHYFRRMREQIEAACATGRLKCSVRGEGLIPPMALRWTRGVWEQWRRNARMSLLTEPYVVQEPPSLYRVTPDQGRMFQAVTMTDNLDTLAQTSPLERPTSRLYRNDLARWRKAIADFHQRNSRSLMLAGLAVVMACAFSRRVVLGPFAVLAIVLTAYALLGISALAYVAAFMGGSDHRHMFANYTLQTLIAVPVVGAAVLAVWRSLGTRPLLHRIEAP